MTLDELRDGDIVKEVNGLQIYYRDDVVPHIGRLKIVYENNRLGLHDINN